MSLKDINILSLDDDGDFQDLLETVLTNQGASLSRAVTIKSAFKLIERQLPHLIILDMKLVGEDGFDFLAKKNQSHSLKDIPVLVSSAIAHPQLLQKLKPFNVEFLVKPIRPADLIQRVKKIVKTTPKLSYVLKNEDPSEVTIHMDANITKTNEMYSFVISPVFMPPKSRLDLTIEFCKKNDIHYAYLETSGQSKFISSGRYETPIVFIGLSEESATKLRGLQNKWGLNG